MKTIPFDLSRAKTPDNPDGLDVTDGFGSNIRIIYTNVRHCYSIAAIRPLQGGDESVEMYTEEGKYDLNLTAASESDLRLVDPGPSRVEVWGFLYKGLFGDWRAFPTTFPSKDEAEKARRVYMPASEDAKVIRFYEYTEEEEDNNHDEHL